MGFGHRVYKVKDPRAAILQGLAEQLFDKVGRDDYYDIALRARAGCRREARSQGSLS